MEKTRKQEGLYEPARRPIACENRMSLFMYPDNIDLCYLRQRDECLRRAAMERFNAARDCVPSIAADCPAN